MGKRINDADKLDMEALHEGLYGGMWVAVAQYDKAHLVGAQWDTAQCGAPLVVDLDWWARFRLAMSHAYEYDPGPWYIAEERRKDSKCVGCKNVGSDDLSVGPESGEVSSGRLASEAAVAMGRPLVNTPSARLQRVRDDAAVGRVARELGAQVL